MRYINNNLDSQELIINNAETLIELQSDLDCNFVGLFKITSDKTKAVQFYKTSEGNFKGRLSFTIEDLPYLKPGHIFQLLALECHSTQHSNEVTISLDLGSIKNTVKTLHSSELLELRTTVLQLSKTFEDVLKKGKIDGINIVGNEYIKPGMVPVSIDNQGNCIWEYPFLDIITNLNNLTTADKKLWLKAEHIPSGNTTVEKRLNAQTDAIKTLGQEVSKLNEMFIKYLDKLAKIEEKLMSHTDSSIV